MSDQDAEFNRLLAMETGRKEESKEESENAEALIHFVIYVLAGYSLSRQTVALQRRLEARSKPRLLREDVSDMHALLATLDAMRKDVAAAIGAIK